MRSIPAYAHPDIIEYLAQRKASGDEDAARLLGRIPTRRKNGKRTPSRQQTRREEHKASTGTLREQTWERCQGKDEITGEELGAAWHLHHVQGAGERRSKQRPGSVLALSWETHRRIHRGDLDLLRRVASAPTLDAEARRAAQRRADKAIAARGVPLRVRVA